MNRLVVVLALAFSLTAGSPTDATAQVFGPFSWQLSPYCNVLTLLATYTGTAYRLEGTDNQCGAAQATALGLAVLNSDGSVSFGVTVVSAPGAAPVHLEVSLSLATFGGTWRDSSGNSGAMVFNPPAPGGPPRPGAVLFSELQYRIGGSCSGGAFMQGVNQDGSVACATASIGTGDITAVAAGPGLTGGGASGDVALAVAFGGDGTAITAARSDHEHALTNGSNTAIGVGAMSALTTGIDNTAVGFGALAANAVGTANVGIGRDALAATASTNGINGSRNVAMGHSALKSMMTGVENIGIGHEAAWQSVTGAGNVAVGSQALFANILGSDNVAIGRGALGETGGTNNIAIGNRAGFNHETGDNNVYIAHDAVDVAHEDDTIRLGQVQTRTFIVGIRGVTTSHNNAVPVLIDSDGQLGTASSSARYKEDIADLGPASSAIMRLRPVTFRYRKPFADGAKPVQYGLIAEEVAQVMPSLTVFNDAGEAETVKYQELPTLLLNELQRLEREKQALGAKLAAQDAELAGVREELAALRAMIERLTSSRQ